MAHLPWRGQVSDHALLSDLLQNQVLAPNLATSHLAPHLTQSQNHENTGLLETVMALNDFAASNDLWLRHAAERLKKASPTSLWLAWTLQNHCRSRGFSETVALETQVSGACLRYGDFTAGIYTTLFDRNHPVVWQQQNLANLDQEQLCLAFPMLFN